ncbi:MAG: hypothetical protein CEN90_6 [Parcubacteria group bacterium Licking1014_17]|nr:MAG: hypothetical protein CEN90_6 [Parcubacteria group bacterium Licking1014_17]
MPSKEDNPVIYFGVTNYRNKQEQFGIKLDDRRRHMYIVGKSGVGKSELLKILAIQDIQAGRGLAFVDPHGDPVEDLLDYIPDERLKDVVYINPADIDYPIGFNVMEEADISKRHLVADGIMAVFKKIWIDAWSARMEYILNYTILALLEMPGATLLGINRMLADKAYRQKVVANLTDPTVKAFWTEEFAKYTERFAAEATPAIQNKVGQFVSSTVMRNIIGQTKSSVDMREVMDNNKILLINVSKGRIGEDASRLLGAMIITKIQLAAMSRIDVPPSERKDFALYVDEFQNFATASFANILSEARKFKLSLIMGHQYIAQLEEEVRDAVFGNVGTLISFRVGAEDAEALEKELAPEFTATDIVNLGKRNIYVKLLIDGIASKAFSAYTMDTPAPLYKYNRDRVIEYTRKQYARPREEVEKDIIEWHQPVTGFTPAPERRGTPAPRETGSGVKIISGDRLAPKPILLSDTFKNEPVDFKGRKAGSPRFSEAGGEEKSPNNKSIKPPKIDVDSKGLRELLQEAMDSKKEKDEE